MPRRDEPATIGSPRSKPRCAAWRCWSRAGRRRRRCSARSPRKPVGCWKSTSRPWSGTTQDAITIVGTWTRTGAPPPIPVGNRLPLGGRNLTTVVYQTGRSARVDYDDVSGAIGHAAARDWGLRSSAGVPIRVEGRLWGAMFVAFTREEPLPADTEARLAGFTELVATAVANAQARTELRRFAEEQA